MIEYSVPQIARRDRPLRLVIRVPFWGYTAALDDLTLAALQDATLIQIASPRKFPKGYGKAWGCGSGRRLVESRKHYTACARPVQITVQQCLER